MSRKSRRLAKVQRDQAAMSRDLDTKAALASTAATAPRPASGKVLAGGGADWFSPHEPLPPVAPPQVAGRGWDFPVGYNLGIVPRQYEAVGFAEMRALADSYDVLRLVIETRKDQMERLTWSIKPRTLIDGSPATSPTDPAIQELTDFFSCPDGENDWGVWMRQVLEDMFVVDAVSIYCDQTYGGKLLALELVDGATIKRVIDDWGRTPAPPAPAYQQVLKGMPAVDYTTDDLIYMPRNSRVHRAYGFSVVEQIITTVNIGLRRQLFQLNYYAEGNMPEALVGAPDTWTPDQIADFQNWWDALLAGDLAARRHVKFVPGGIGKTFIPTKEPELTGKMDEWLARVVCYALSVPPTPFVQQTNRATAESAHDAALEEGLAPIQNFIVRLISRVMRKFWPQYAKKLEFAWDDDREVDALVQEQVHSGYVTNGVKTINEVRDELGLPPKKGGEELLVKTASGYAPVDAPPAPPPMAGVAPAKLGPDGKPLPAVKPGPAKAKPDKEAQAAKVAGPFRARKVQKLYWGPPRRVAPRHPGGPGGDEETRP